MRKSNLIAIAVSTIMLSLSAVEILAQQREMVGVFNQGNYYTASEIPGGGYGRCYCGQAAYNCLCGFVNFSDFEAPNITVGQIGVVVSKPVVLSNTLQIQFKEKLKMDLKTNEFVQKEAVDINKDIAKSLGYRSIKILPGTYTIKDDNSLVFNIEKGDPYTTYTARWGWIGFIVVLIILASIIGGQSSAPSGSTTSQDCGDCRRDIAWYNSLSIWRKILFHAWYLTRWTICKARGCI